VVSETLGAGGDRLGPLIPRVPGCAIIHSVSNSADRLPLSRILFYSLPFVGSLAMSLPAAMWYPKFSTDELLIAPSVMGAILFAARFWDAISDPMAGYLSDRTRTAFGRRRSWIAGAAIPVGLTYVMLWSPPAGLEPAWLIAWIAVAMILWETASTAFYVPYTALGLELTNDYHDRTRLFGWRQTLVALGYGASLAAIAVMRNDAEYPDAEVPVAIATGSALALMLLVTVWRVPEPARHQGRGGTGIWTSFRDVLRNPHARLLLLVLGIDSFGMGTVASLGAYMADEVVRAPELLVEMMAYWMVPQFLCVPGWVWLSRRVGKKALWIGGMLVSIAGFLGMLFVGEGDVMLVRLLVLAIGVGTSISLVIGPSVQADVVDYDDFRTGDRKEGAYVAAWNFLRKLGSAIAMSLGLVLLDWAGYDPQLEVQNENVQQTIRLMMGALPAGAFVIGALAFARFSLDESAHRRVKSELLSREAFEQGEEQSRDGE